MLKRQEMLLNDQNDLLMQKANASIGQEYFGCF
jgi:hypothetical protein